MKGYKYNTETEAIAARQIAADYMGLPVEGGETLYWINYEYSQLDGFYYIKYVDDLENVLGPPIELEITQPEQMI